MKKLLCMLLALVMVFSLVACTGNQSEGGDEVIGEDYYENATFENAVVLGDSEWDGSLPLIPEGEEYTVTIGVKTSALVTDYANIDYIKWLEEQTGVNVEIITFAGSSSDVGTQLSLMVTGEEELPDIMVSLGLGQAIVKDFGREGYFMNLAGYMKTQAHYMKEALQLYYPDEADYAYAMENMWYACGDKENGKVFHFPSVFYNVVDNLQTHIMINTEWLEAVGKEIPTTVEELYDVLVAFRDEDPNGNGIKDEIPMIGLPFTRGCNVLAYLINAFIQYHYDYKFIIEDGKLTTPYIEPEFREAMKFINKLCEEGLLSEMTFTTNKNEIKSMLNPEEGQPFTVGIASGSIDGYYNEDHESIYVYDPLPPLKDATGRGGYGMMYADTFTVPVYLSNNIERPEIAWRLLDFMCSGESYLRQRWGDKGVSWDWLDEGTEAEGNGMFGGTARFKLLKQDTFGSTSNETWHNQVSQCSETYWQFYLDPEVMPWNAEVYKDMSGMYDAYMEAGQPEHTFAMFLRNPQEEEAFYEYNSDMLEYVKTSLSELSTGLLDPNSDADWQTFTDGLYQLHMQESWLDPATSSWNRYKENHGIK